MTNRSEVVKQTFASGVSSVTNEAVSVEFYDLTGARVLNPGNGLYIKKINFKDGKSIVSKVARR